MITVIARKVIQRYAQPEAPAALRILTATDNKIYKVLQTNQLGPWHSAPALDRTYGS